MTLPALYSNIIEQHRSSYFQFLNFFDQTFSFKKAPNLSERKEANKKGVSLIKLKANFKV